MQDITEFYRTVPHPSAFITVTSSQAVFGHKMQGQYSFVLKLWQGVGWPSGALPGGWTPTVLTLLHDIHHVPSFESHLRCGALLVVCDGSVRLQDNGARDVCMRQVTDVPSSSPQPIKTLFQAGQKQLQDSPKCPPSLSQPQSSWIS